MEHTNGTGPERDLFTTSTGITIELVAVSPLFIDKVQNTVKLPDKPKRRVPLDIPMAPGEEPTVEEVELTANTLQTDEERKEWADYQRDLAEAQRERNQKVQKVLFARGIKVDMADLEEWKAERTYWGLEIPTHSVDIKVAYIEDKVIGGVGDMQYIMDHFLEKAGIAPGTMQAVSDSFRDPVRRPAAVESATADDEVDAQLPLPGDEDGLSLESRAAE